MINQIEECHWPELREPYSQALREAVTFVLESFKVLGIIASGTIIRGNPHRNSDFDIYVIHAREERQLIQKYFNSIPTQIFLNPPNIIYQYFINESRQGRPSTAHMLATGFVILNHDPIIERLRQQAATILTEGSKPLDDQLKLHRYSAADRFENVLDIADSDSATANMLLNLVVYDMLHYYFLKRKQFIPRDKDLLRKVHEQEPNLGQACHDFYSTEVLGQRLDIARKIADLTIETQGFFEWQSQPEKV
jgi:hypothetical protein